MPNNLYLLVVIANVSDVFDEVEAKTGFRVVGVFLDLSLAQIHMMLIADDYNHGDRLAIFGYDASKSEGYSEVIAIVDSEVVYGQN